MAWWLIVLIAIGSSAATAAVMWLVTIGDARTAMWRGALGTLGVLLLVWLVVQVWFTYNRALAGAEAWTCLHQPQCVASFLPQTPMPKPPQP